MPRLLGCLAPKMSFTENLGVQPIDLAGCCPRTWFAVAATFVHHGFATIEQRPICTGAHGIRPCAPTVAPFSGTISSLLRGSVNMPSLCARYRCDARLPESWAPLPLMPEIAAGRDDDCAQVRGEQQARLCTRQLQKISSLLSDCLCALFLLILRIHILHGSVSSVAGAD